MLLPLRRGFLTPPCTDSSLTAIQRLVRGLNGGENFLKKEKGPFFNTLGGFTIVQAGVTFFPHVDSFSPKYDHFWLFSRYFALNVVRRGPH